MVDPCRKEEQKTMNSQTGFNNISMAAIQTTLVGAAVVASQCNDGNTFFYFNKTTKYNNHNVYYIIHDSTAEKTKYSNIDDDDILDTSY
jgi:hypothetical protein